MSLQNELENLLKGKGIGPESSKSLKAENKDIVLDCLASREVSLVTKSTFLVALLLLHKNEAEIDIIESLSTANIPNELHFLLNQEASNSAETAILKLINKEELKEEELNLLLHSNLKDFHLSALLEGLRLKRETLEENQVIFKSFLKNSTESVSVKSDLILFADAFDGNVRISPYTIFTAILLAEMGYKCYMHSIDEVAPKRGLSVHQILEHVGYKFHQSPNSAVKQLNDIGFTYLSQDVVFPELFKMKETRRLMVKRPVLATFEKLIMPIRGERNICVTGYTHKAYKMMVPKVLQRVDCFDMLLNVKGQEGTSIPALNLTTPLAKLENGEITELEYEPVTFELDKDTAIGVEHCIRNGEAALQGQQNLAYSNIVNQATLVLQQITDKPKNEIIQELSTILNSKSAFKLWRCVIQS